MAKNIKELIPELHEYVRVAMNDQRATEFSRLQRDLELHPSGFPYCPLRHMYDFLQDGKAPTVDASFAGSYFTSIGTLVHELIQTFMGMGGRIWGHWKCSNHGKGCNYKSMDEISVYHDCPACGYYCTYEEIGFNINGVLVGHMDCLYEDLDGNYWIVDYKTTLLMKAQKQVKDGQTLSSNPTYRAQQRCYVTLTHRKYGKSHGIKPKGWVLCFMPRDIPFQYVLYGEDVSLDEKKAIWDRIVHDMDALEEVIEATQFSDIEHLVDTKPCATMKQYTKEVHNIYAPCPLTAVCFNRKALVQVMRTEMDDHVLLPMTRHYKSVIEEQDVMRSEIESDWVKYSVRVEKGDLDD